MKDDDNPLPVLEEIIFNLTCSVIHVWRAIKAVWRDRKTRFFSLFVVALAILFFLAGCTQSAQPVKGGSSGAVLGGAVASSSVTTSAPENPSTPSSYSLKKTVTREFFNPSVPSISVTPSSTPPVVKSRIQDSPVSNESVSTEIKTNSPMVAKEITSEEVTTTTGASHKDDASEIRAKLDNLKPTQYAGVGLLALSLAMFYPPVRLALGAGKEMQMWFAAGGIFLIYAPSIFVGNEKMVLGLVVAALAVFYLQHRSSHKSGVIDALKQTDDTKK